MGIVFAVSACVQPAGGACQYLTVESLTQVRAVNEEAVTVFAPELNQELQLAPSRLQAVSVGEEVPVRIQQLERGSCTPLVYEVMNGES